MSGWHHMWVHTLGPAPWFIWAIRTAVLVGPLWLLGTSVRRMRQGRGGYRQFAIWAAGTWVVYALGRVEFFWPHHSRGYWVAVAVQMLFAIPWIVWGAGWVIPFCFREEREWKAKRRRVREAGRREEQVEANS